MRLLSTVTLIALTGCNAALTQGPNLDLDDLPATISLRLGEQRLVAGSVVSFQAVPSDSRCPTDVVCAWAGNAEVDLMVEPALGEGASQHLVVNSTLEPRSGSAAGLRFSLLRLGPEPVSTRPTSGYRVELRVEAVIE